MEAQNKVVILAKYYMQLRDYPCYANFMNAVLEKNSC